MRTLDTLVRRRLIKGVFEITFKKDSICKSCELGKLKRTFQNKLVVSTSKPLELLHMDLFGPTRYESLNDCHFCVVVVDDYNRFAWVMFLKNKDETFEEFAKLYKKLQNERI